MDSLTKLVEDLETAGSNYHKAILAYDKTEDGTREKGEALEVMDECLHYVHLVEKAIDRYLVTQR